MKYEAWGGISPQDEKANIAYEIWLETIAYGEWVKRKAGTMSFEDWVDTEAEAAFESWREAQVDDDYEGSYGRTQESR